MLKRDVVIDVKNLQIQFGNKIILKDVNLSVNEGDIFRLNGPNGSGKSVLIGTLVNIVEPRRGDVTLFGLKYSNHSEKIYQKISYLSSYSNLQENLSAMDNLLFYSGIYGIHKPRKKIDFLTSILEIESIVASKKKIFSLSSGELCRLILCKSLLNDPQIIFVDEAFSTLDKNISPKIFRLLVSLNKQRQMTIFYVSHEEIELNKYCTKNAFIKNKKIIIRNDQ